MADDILLKVRGDTDDAKRSLEEVGSTGERELGRVTDAADRVDLSGIERESRDGARSLGDLEKAAVDAAREVATLALQQGKGVIEAKRLAEVEYNRVKAELAGVADETEKVQKGFLAVSAATKAAQAAGVESGDKIAKATEAVIARLRDTKEGANAAEVAFESFGGSPAEFIGKTNSELERSVVLLGDAEKNLRQLDEEALEGLSGFADRAAKVQQRLDLLEASLERQGEQAAPELRRELERLRAQFSKTFEDGARQAGKLEAEIERNEESVRRYKLETQGAAAGTVDLTTLAQTRFPAAAKSILGAVSAVAVLKTTFQETRNAIEFLKTLGVDIDGIVAKLDPFGRLVQALGIGVESLADEASLATAQLGLLARNGVDEVAEKAKRLQTEIRQLTAESAEYLSVAQDSTTEERARAEALDKHEQAEARLVATLSRANHFIREGADAARDATVETNAQAAAVRKLTEAAEGFKSADLASAYQDAVHQLTALTKRADEVRGTPIFDTLVEQVRELREQLATAPDEVRAVFDAGKGPDTDEAIAKLDELAEGMGFVASVTNEAAEAQEELAEEATEAAKRAAEAQKAAAEATLASWETAGQGVLDVFRQIEAENATDDTRPQNLDDARQQLAEVEAQINAIRGKSLLDPEDVAAESDLIQQRVQLQQQIGELQNDLRLRPTLDIEGLGSELQQQFGALQNDVQFRPGLDVEGLAEEALTEGQRVAQALREGLVESGFAEAFAELPKSVQNSVRTILSEFEAVAEGSARLDPELVKSYVDSVARELGEVAPEAAAKFSVAIGGAGSEVSSVIDILGFWESSASKATTGLVSLKEGAENLGKAGEGGGIIKVGDQIFEVGTAAESAAKNTITTADGVIAIDEAGRKGGIIKVGDDIIRLGDFAEEAADGLQRGATAARETATAADEAATATGQQADSTARLADEGARAADAVGDVGTESGTTRRQLADLGNDTDDLATDLRDLRDVGVDGAATLSIVGREANAAATGAERLESGLEGVLKQLRAISASEDVTIQAVTLIEQIRESVQGLSEDLATVVEQTAEIAKNLQAADEAVD